MHKVILIFVILCVCLMFSTGARSYAEPGVKPLSSQEQIQMQEHIEKVKITNPGKYQNMIENTGENVTDCCNCHKEICDGKDFPSIPEPLKITK